MQEEACHGLTLAGEAGGLLVRGVFFITNILAFVFGEFLKASEFFIFVALLKG